MGVGQFGFFNFFRLRLGFIGIALFLSFAVSPAIVVSIGIAVLGIVVLGIVVLVDIIIYLVTREIIFNFLSFLRIDFAAEDLELLVGFVYLIPIASGKISRLLTHISKVSCALNVVSIPAIRTTA